MGRVERVLDDLEGTALALLDAPVVTVAFFLVLILISLGRIPDPLAPLFYGGLAALLLLVVVATLLTRDKRRARAKR